MIAQAPKPEEKKPEAWQLNMFGPPEAVSSYPENRRGRCDDAPVPCERENLWPADLVRILGADLLERLYGDIPRRTRLYTLEVCRRLRCDSNTVYRHLEQGSLDGTDISTPDATKAEWRTYRYSLVSLLFNREFRDQRTRADLAADDLSRIEAACAARRKKRNPRG